MAEITLSTDTDGAKSSGTKVGQFLANRGVIIIKEFKEVGKVGGDYGTKIQAEAMILKAAKSSARVDDTTYGIKLEMLKEGDTVDSAVLDFDESEEFLGAIQFIFDAAQKISGQRTDYIEATFSTKDHIVIGFFKTPDDRQSAFIKLSPHGESCFLAIQAIPVFGRLVQKARDHLLAKGAGQESA